MIHTSRHEIHAAIDAPGFRLFGSTQVGNCYTASVFAGLVSVVAAEGSSLEYRDGGGDGGGARILVFSYGSGFVATTYRYKTLRFELN